MLLPVRCGNCQSEGAPGAKFCATCGRAIAAGSGVSEAATIDASARDAYAREAPTTPLSAPNAPSPGFMPGGSRAFGADRVPMLSSSGSHASLHGRFSPGQVLGGRYRVVGLLGRGGMGEVYRADDMTLGVAVALKFLPAGLGSDPTKLARFLNEVRTTRQISHSAVCRVYDVVEIPDPDPIGGAIMETLGAGAGPQTIEAARQAALTSSRPTVVTGQRALLYCISMEYVDGEDLGSLLRRIGRLPNDKAVEIARQVCAGLAAAHDQGIVHRDLKPANIMLDGRGKARVMDFGVAGLGEALNAAGDVTAGTPAYMAPEQLSGQAVSARSDLYSLGLVLYELFTGKPTWAGRASGIAELRHLHDTAAPESPSKLVPDLDPVVERVILRCLERDPSRRPSSALQVAAALPGGDPLAAALAAGETPSPEMVAASGAVGALSRRAAAIWSVVLLVSLAGSLALTKLSPTTIEDLAPLSQSALRAKAEEIMRDLGRTEAPKDYAFGLAWSGAATEYIRSAPAAGAAERPGFNDPWLPVMRFFYRRSPTDLLLPHPTISNVQFDAPPMVMRGSARLELDAHGRLLRFESIPELDTASAADASANVDWSRFIAWTGLDPATLSETEPERSPLVAARERRAWKSEIPTVPPTPVRIEAAAERGEPVSFMVTYPWTTTDRATPKPASNALETVGPIIQTTLILSAIAGGVLMTLSHRRAGRIDRRGAAAVWIAIFLPAWLGSSIIADNPAALFRVQSWLGNSMYYALWISSLGALFYVACEPILRKVWPGMLISWARVLSGRWRDPLVGRDTLMGISLGAAFSLLMSATALFRDYQDRGFNEPFQGSISALRSFNTLAAHLLRGAAGSAIMVTLLIGMLLLGARVLLRSNKSAIAAVCVVVFVIHTVSFGDSTLGLIMAAVATAMITGLIILGGLLPMAAFLCVTNVALTVPLTWNPASWAFPFTLAAMAAVLLPAAWALHTSLGHQRLMADDRALA